MRKGRKGGKHGVVRVVAFTQHQSWLNPYWGEMKMMSCTILYSEAPILFDLLIIIIGGTIFALNWKIQKISHLLCDCAYHTPYTFWLQGVAHRQTIKSRYVTPPHRISIHPALHMFLHIWLCISNILNKTVSTHPFVAYAHCSLLSCDHARTTTKSTFAKLKRKASEAN